MAHTMREFHPEPRVKVSPENGRRIRPAGRRLDLDGERRGALQARWSRCSRAFRTTALSAEHGWWKPEERGRAAPHLYDCFDYNVNNLTRNFQAGPGGIGSPIKCTRCRIYKVPGRRRTPAGVQITRARRLARRLRADARPRGGERIMTKANPDQLRLLHGLPLLRGGLQEGARAAQGRVRHQAHRDRALRVRGRGQGPRAAGSGRGSPSSPRLATCASSRTAKPARCPCACSTARRGACTTARWRSWRRKMDGKTRWALFTQGAK